MGGESVSAFGRSTRSEEKGEKKEQKETTVSWLAVVVRGREKRRKGMSTQGQEGQKLPAFYSRRGGGEKRRRQERAHSLRIA